MCNIITAVMGLAFIASVVLAPEFNKKIMKLKSVIPEGESTTGTCPDALKSNLTIVILHVKTGREVCKIKRKAIVESWKEVDVFCRVDDIDVELIVSRCFNDTAGEFYVEELQNTGELNTLCNLTVICKTGTWKKNYEKIIEMENSLTSLITQSENTCTSYMNNSIGLLKHRLDIMEEFIIVIHVILFVVVIAFILLVLVIVKIKQACWPNKTCCSNDCNDKPQKPEADQEETSSEDMKSTAASPKFVRSISSQGQQGSEEFKVRRRRDSHKKSGSRNEEREMSGPDSAESKSLIPQVVIPMQETSESHHSTNDAKSSPLPSGE